MVQSVRKNKILYIMSDTAKKQKYEKLKKHFGLNDAMLKEYQTDQNISELFGRMKLDNTYVYSGHKQLPMKTCEAVYSIVRATRPKLCVETGVSAGISSSFILSALKRNNYGKLVSIDCQDKCGWLIQDELKDIWTFKVGYTKDVLPTIKQKIDFFLHDSLHTYQNMFFELEWAFQHMKKGGIIIADNIGTNNAFFDVAKKHNQGTLFIPSSKTLGVGIMIKDLRIDAKTLVDIFGENKENDLK